MLDEHEDEHDEHDEHGHERQSLNAAHIRYRPVRRASRKGAHARTVGHEWRCIHCNALVHEEPLAGFEETEDEASERHLRVQRACAGHDPCPRLNAERAAADADADGIAVGGT